MVGRGVRAYDMMSNRYFKHENQLIERKVYLTITIKILYLLDQWKHTSMIFNTPSKDLQGSYWILSHLQEENVTLTRA